MHFHIGAGVAKLVRCARGRIVDINVDLRRGSPTYGKWEGVELDDVNMRVLYVPVGFAHGFCVLSGRRRRAVQADRLLRPGGRARHRLGRPGDRDRVAAAGAGADRLRARPRRRRGWPRSRPSCRSAIEDDTVGIAGRAVSRQAIGSSIDGHRVGPTLSKACPLPIKCRGSPRSVSRFACPVTRFAFQGCDAPAHSRPAGGLPVAGSAGQADGGARSRSRPRRPPKPA